MYFYGGRAAASLYISSVKKCYNQNVPPEGARLSFFIYIFALSSGEITGLDALRDIVRRSVTPKVFEPRQSSNPII